MKIAVIGATGLVGQEMLTVMSLRDFKEAEVVVAASPRSVGKPCPYGEKLLRVVSVEDAIADRPDYALFSAGAAVSRQYAPRFAEVGTTVIDNSSAWRKEPDVPLVVPEVNMHTVKPTDRIIANPNCSTIQMVLALSALEKRYGIKRLVISTYQSVSGTGMRAVRQLEAEELDELRHGVVEVDRVYPYAIHRNVLPHGGDFLPNGYTTEEEKLVNETRKIYADPSIAITATVVRVPVVRCHSESVNVELRKAFDLDEVRQLIATTPGVALFDNPSENLYPMPYYAQYQDRVHVGRLRRDLSQNNCLDVWIVADNLRKGAATNAVQIMEQLIQQRKK